MRRIVLITGATSGLGYEMAAALAHAPYELVLTCRNAEKGEAVLKKLTDADPEASVRMLKLDLSSFQSIDRFVADVRRLYTSLDVLCNNAGLYTSTSETTAEGFEMTVGVNYLGAYYLTRQLIPLLKQGQQPQIIQTCSIVSIISKAYKDRDNIFRRNVHGFPAYFVSKQMALMMTLYLADELLPDGISVNAFHPGIAATGIWRGESRMMRFLGWKSDKWYTPAREAVKAGLWLIENPAARTMTGKFFEKQGQEIHLAPRFRDKRWLTGLIRRTDEAIRCIRPVFAGRAENAQTDNSTMA